MGEFSICRIWPPRYLTARDGRIAVVNCNSKYQQCWVYIRWRPHGSLSVVLQPLPLLRKLKTRGADAVPLCQTWMKPRRAAMANAWVRSWAPNFSMMCLK
jgi:hypothetical protein